MKQALGPGTYAPTCQNSAQRQETLKVPGHIENGWEWDLPLAGAGGVWYTAGSDPTSHDRDDLEAGEAI